MTLSVKFPSIFVFILFYAERGSQIGYYTLYLATVFIQDEGIQLEGCCIHEDALGQTGYLFHQKTVFVALEMFSFLQDI